MLKNNKGKFVVSSLVILLPVAVGLFLWNTLPEQVPIHWGINGTVDDWASRPFAVFAPPLFLLAIHWLCLFATHADPKNQRQTPKAMGLIYWICPVVSVLLGGLVYGTALGMQLDINHLICLLLGLMFVLIGNYLPKCKQNYTLGIRVVWTLHDEENWNATHRFGGRTWVGGGLLVMLCALLPGPASTIAMMVLVAVLAVAPVVYSYLYYRGQQARKA